MKSLGVIDIGSNTILMTCGRVGPDGSIQIVLDAHEVARMGQGLQDGGNLHPDAKQRVLEALKDFQSQAKDKGITQLLAAGTAAFRRAQDGPEFSNQIKNELDIPVRILTGKEEAKYSFLSVLNDFGAGHVSLGMIDIGGGSTEIVFGKGKPQMSLPIGTVRLLEGYVTRQPIGDLEWAALRHEISDKLKKLVSAPINRPDTWVAVAATPTSIAMVLQQMEEFDPAKVHRFPIERQELADLTETLRRSTMEERLTMKGMHPKRAELLPLGAAILLEMMKFLEIPEVVVSAHGLRYGLLFEALEK